MRINGIKLATAMMRKDLTQKQLAELTGVSRVTINSVKCGKSCSDVTGIKIADALNVPIEELLETE